MRVKMFGSYTRDKLERVINAFLEEHDVEVVDIKYRCDDKWYTVMIIYKVQKGE